MYRYLKREHNLEVSRSNFNAYILRNKEFAEYFNPKTKKEAVKTETPFEKQAQFDWKEKLKFTFKNGSEILINVGSIVLSTSRYKIWKVCPSTSQDFLTTAFERIGGFPEELIVDNAMVKVAGFPHLKELKDFEFEFQPKINKQQFLDFESLRFLENNSNIMLIGNSRVGKTHLATSIGIAAAKKRISTYFIKCQDLIEQLRKAYIEHKLESRIKHFSKYKLLIIDEIGYLPIGEHEAKMFFQLIDRRYECKSTIITSNINLSDWDKIFLDKLLASAILDRLIHHSTIVNISGKSYRTAMALSNISESKKQETCT